MGHPDEATAHFLAASRLARRQVTKQLAAMEAALCMVEEGGEGGVSKRMAGRSAVLSNSIINQVCEASGSIGVEYAWYLS